MDFNSWMSLERELDKIKENISPCKFPELLGELSIWEKFRYVVSGAIRAISFPKKYACFRETAPGLEDV